MKNELAVRLKTLSPNGQALVTTLVKSGHLERKELMRVVRRRSPLAKSIFELRDKGFLVPLLGRNKATVFWLPSEIAGNIGTALEVIVSVPPDVQRKVNDQLRAVGYGTQS